MKKYCAVCLWILTFCCMLITPAFCADSTYDRIKSRGKLVVATSPSYFPFEIYNKENELIGYDIDVARFIAKELDVELELIPFEWDGIVPALTTKKVDVIIACMNITEERSKVVSFSKPYFTADLGLLINEKYKQAGIHSWRDLDLQDIKIAVMQGTTAHFYAEKYFEKAQVVPFVNGSENMAMAVSQGKVDACSYDAPWCSIYAKKNPKGLFAFTEEEHSEEPVGIAFQKGDVKFKQCLDNIVTKWLEQDNYKGIYEYWFKDMPWMDEVSDKQV